MRTSPSFHAVPRRLFPHAVDADMRPAFDQRSGRGARFHHPRVPQPLIETLSLQMDPIAFSSEVGTGSREENASKIKSLFLVAAGELFLQRRQFRERRIRIGRTVTVARCGAWSPTDGARGRCRACRDRPCRGRRNHGPCRAAHGRDHRRPCYGRHHPCCDRRRRTFRSGRSPAPCCPDPGRGPGFRSARRSATIWTRLVRCRLARRSRLAHPRLPVLRQRRP